MLLTGLALGAVLGFVMQRGRFCVTGMIRDIFTQKTWRGINNLSKLCPSLHRADRGPVGRYRLAVVRRHWS